MRLNRSKSTNAAPKGGVETGTSGQRVTLPALRQPVQTLRRFDPNIQRVRATVNGTPKRLNVCTGCLKAGKVTR